MTWVISVYLCVQHLHCTSHLSLNLMIYKLMLNALTMFDYLLHWWCLQFLDFWNEFSSSFPQDFCKLYYQRLELIQRTMIVYLHYTDHELLYPSIVLPKIIKEIDKFSIIEHHLWITDNARPVIKLWWWWWWWAQNIVGLRLLAFRNYLMIQFWFN